MTRRWTTFFAAVVLVAATAVVGTALQQNPLEISELQAEKYKDFEEGDVGLQ